MRRYLMTRSQTIPVITQFLNYDPSPEPKTLPQHLLAKRREKGWAIEEAAEVIGVDPGTWGGWEHGQMILYRQHSKLIAQTLGLPAGTHPVG